MVCCGATETEKVPSGAGTSAGPAVQTLPPVDCSSATPFSPRTFPVSVTGVPTGTVTFGREIESRPTET